MVKPLAHHDAGNGLKQHVQNLNVVRGNRRVVAACAPGLSGPGRSGTALAARRILTGPALQHILCWAASIGHPARSPLIRQSTRRFDVAQPATTHRLPLNEGAMFSVWKLKRLIRVAEILCPIWKSLVVAGSAYGDAGDQGEDGHRPYGYRPGWQVQKCGYRDSGQVGQRADRVACP